MNQNPEKMRSLLVDHEGKKRLVVQVAEPLADQSDWSDEMKEADALLRSQTDRII